MRKAILNSLRSYLQRPLVRPWALTGPVIILLICLPALRPLRQPDPALWSNQEQLLAATVHALVDHHTLAIDDSVFGDNPAAAVHQQQHYSPYPPMYALLLAPIYLLMRTQGLDYSRDLIFCQYLLTIAGAALPVAMSMGLLYRLGRMFEIRRSLRTSLGLAGIIGGGLIAYGVVLNRQAPAAMFLLAAISCISHLAVARHPPKHLIMAALGGFCAAMAAAIDPPAMMLGILVITAILAMRWGAAIKVGAISLYLLGAAAVMVPNGLLLEATGQSAWRMLSIQQPTVMPESPILVRLPHAQASFLETYDEDADVQPSWVRVVWNRLADFLGRALESLVGEHGALSHYPVLIVGILGAIWVLHRNWTTATKCMAIATLLAAGLLLVAQAFEPPDRPQSYGAPWLTSTTPLLMLWAGAWLKHRHRPQSWVMAAIVLVFSVVVGLVGMSDPTPRGGYRGYSFVQAASRLIGSDEPRERSTDFGDPPRALSKSVEKS